VKPLRAGFRSMPHQHVTLGMSYATVHPIVWYAPFCRVLVGLKVIKVATFHVPRRAQCSHASNSPNSYSMFESVQYLTCCSAAGARKLRGQERKHRFTAAAPQKRANKVTTLGAALPL
jgi:hypothetical protein